MSGTAVQLPRNEDIVDLLSSDGEQEHQANRGGTATAGGTRQACSGPPLASRPPAHRRASGAQNGRQPQAAGGAGPTTAAAAAPQQQDEDVVDLTASPDIEIVSSTVAPVQRQKGVKRPRYSPAPHQKAVMAMLALQQQQKAAAPLPEPEPPGPKCGVCLEPMGGSSAKTMWAGNCGHVYCKECLTEAVRMTKKCPTCRKNLQLRQLHQVFLNF